MSIERRPPPANATIVGNDQHGRLVALIDQAGKIRCRWSLRGRRDAGGGLSFALPLPACPINVLELTLPSELVPTVDGGLNYRPGRRSRRAIVDGGSIWRKSSTNIANRQTGGVGRAANQTHRSTIVRLRILSTRIRADRRVPNEWKRQFVGKINLLVDPPLTVVAARMGGTDLSIATVKAEESGPPKDAEEIALPNSPLDLPESIQASGSVLRISAIAPLVSDARWRLPMVQIKNSLWQEGAARLQVSAPLLLNELVLRDCRQTSMEPLPESAPGEAIEIQFFNSHPVMELALSRPRQPARVERRNRNLLARNEGLGRYQAEFSAEAPARFNLQAEVCAAMDHR